MGEEAEQPFENLLKLYDEQRKDDSDSRRTAAKSLYDFFRRVLVSVGVDFCGLPGKPLKGLAVKGAWEEVKRSLAMVESTCSRWDELISNIQHVRDKDHDIDYDPPLGNLEKLRKAAPDFRKWVLVAGNRLLGESKGWTLREHHNRVLEVYVDRAKYLLEQYGAENGYMHEIIEGDSDLLAGVEAHLKAKRRESAQDAAMEFADIQDVGTICEIVGRVQGLESFLLSKGTCPKCGGKIKETEQAIGGGYDEPPSEVHLRTGCEDCEFELYSETINI
jgi:hypothetical protein